MPLNFSKQKIDPMQKKLFTASRHGYYVPEGPDFSIIGPSSSEAPRNDTASVAPLGDGSIMAVWHKYRPNPEGTSDFGTADIACKTSRDGGITWGDERILVENAEGDNNVQAPALRQTRNGNVLLASLRGHAGGGSSSMILFRSIDHGETFEEVSKVWNATSGQWLQGGTSSILELQSGRLFMPFHYGSGHQGSQHNIGSCMLSDDGGRTWRKSNHDIRLPMRGVMELSAAELPDGELIASIRTQLGAVFLTRSTDQGETWTLPQTTGLRAPESCTCLRCLPDSEDLLLIWNDGEYDPNHHHYGFRNPLSLALSRDRGGSWKKLGDLCSRETFNFTNLGCDFIDADHAIVTYVFWGPDYPMGDNPYCWHNPEVMDLHGARIGRDWIYAAYEQAVL